MTTARIMVKKALQKAGIMTKTETPSSDEINDGLDTLNGMLSSWSNESLLIYARLRESFTLSAGVASYTIGSGGDFDTVRPISISSVFIRSGSTDYTVESFSGVEYDTSIVDKDAEGIPIRYTYDNNVPLGTISFYPVPNQADTVFIRSEKILTQFALDDTVTLPAGWEHAIIHNLAEILAPEYGQTVNPVISREAATSKAGLKKAVTRNRDMDTLPLVGGGGFNILNGRIN